MRFRITGLSPQPFQHLFGLPDAELAGHGAKRCIADEKPGFPCRIEMPDAGLGKTVLLLNHTYQPANTPYHGAHAIFVREGAMRARLLSLRAFDADGMMLDADVVDGRQIEPVIDRMFATPEVSYIQVHNARRGCYSGRIDRA